MPDAFGSLFTFSLAGITLNIPVAGTFVKWSDFLDGEAGPVDLVLVDGANNQLTIGANGKGIYNCTVTWSGKGSANTLIVGSIHVNGVRQQRLEFEVDISSPAEREVGSLNDEMALEVGDVVDLRFTTDRNNRNVIATRLTFVLAAVLRAIVP